MDYAIVDRSIENVDWGRVTGVSVVDIVGLDDLMRGRRDVVS